MNGTKSKVDTGPYTYMEIWYDVDFSYVNNLCTSAILL